VDKWVRLCHCLACAHLPLCAWYQAGNQGWGTLYPAIVPAGLCQGGVHAPVHPPTHSTLTCKNTHKQLQMYT